MARKEGTAITFKQWATQKVTKFIYKKLYAEARLIAADWYDFFVQQFQGPKTGRFYRLSKKNRPRLKYQELDMDSSDRGATYQASAVGEYPAQKSGFFLQNLHIFVGSFNPETNIRLYLRSDADYTVALIKMHRKLFAESKAEFYEIAKERLDNLKGKRTKIT